MTTSSVKLSSNIGFISSSKVTNANNTYIGLLKSGKNIGNTMSHNISTKPESVVMLIYNSRSGLLFMDSNVIKSVRRLKDIANLPLDWNGYGAKPFSDVLIDKCERIANILSVQPAIYPTGRNSIQFQYELNDRSYLEFEIFENKTMCLQVPKRVYSEAIELELKEQEEDRIKEIVDEFHRRDGAEK